MSGRVIVLGAGHNGLATAATLGKAGRSVLVLEASDHVGGLAERDEFHPGYSAPGVLHDTWRLRPWVIDDLDLTQHGLKLRAREATVLVTEAQGPGFLIDPSDEHPTEQLATRSSADAEAWRRFRGQIGRLRRFLQRILDEAPPDVESESLSSLWELAKTGLALRRLGRRDMAELLRVGPMCVADWLNEFFETDSLKGALAESALAGSWMGPWSPGSSALLLLNECARHRSVVGGPAAVADALAAAATAAGAEIRTGARVERLLLEGGRVVGVRLADGEALPADVVAASCNPRRTLLELIEPVDLPPVLEARATAWRCRGTTAVVRLALGGPAVFRDRPGERIERARVVGSLDDLERAFDGVKYGRLPEAPALDVAVPSIDDPGLAPAGKDVVTVLVHFVPYALKAGWDQAARDRVGDLTVATLARVAPGLPDQIVGRQVLGPVDLERRHGLTGGQIDHGEPALDQLLHMRPATECSRYATPLPGLYLCGSGSHPGGGITGAPGVLAARAVLQA